MGPLEQKRQDRLVGIIGFIICHLTIHLLTKFKSELGIQDIFQYFTIPLLVLSAIFALIFVLRM